MLDDERLEKRQRPSSRMGAVFKIENSRDSDDAAVTSRGPWFLAKPRQECTDSIRFGLLRGSDLRKSLRKEVIQPQVLLRLPCYDLVPVTDLAVGTTVSWRLRALPAPMT